jgi:hypothetical protein
MDKSWPTFNHFSVNEQKLTKLSQYCTVFPSRFSNIFLKSFKLLQNLMRNYEILQYLMTFHKNNDISWNSSGNNTRLSWSSKVKCWLSVLLLVLSKDDSKISVSFIQTQNFEVSNLAMAKVQKVNIAFTYFLLSVTNALVWTNTLACYGICRV